MGQHPPVCDPWSFLPFPPRPTSLLDRHNIPLRCDAQPHRGRTMLVGTGFRFKMSVVPASPRLDE
jgi:hypothetical protein